MAAVRNGVQGRLAKKLHIKTFGCQMNVYDSSRMADVLAPLGYELSDHVEEADMVIVNTCHIREKAAEKLYSELGRYRQVKEARTGGGEATVIAVAGCVAQAEGAEIMNRAPFVDIVVGPQTYHQLPELVARAARAKDEKKGGKRKGSGVLAIDFPAESKFDQLPPVRHQGPTAFLSVQEGCDKFCTFCVVPYTRGAEYSRPADEVVAEARELAAAGAREITLLGQNVNAYHGVDAGGKAVGLGELIRRLADVDGISRIRYTTSHPIDMSDELIAAHRDVDALMPFLHLPVQSGSDRILARMNRHHDMSLYCRVVEKLMTARPDMKLSSDFIVGFPGETDADFQATLELAREVEFIQAFSFKYSARPGTPGALMDNQVPEDVKSERLAVLQDVLTGNQAAFNRSCVDRVMPVLLDRKGRKQGQLAGRSPYLQPVHVDAPDSRFGQIVDLRIVAGHENSLAGELPADGTAPSLERVVA